MKTKTEKYKSSEEFGRALGLSDIEMDLILSRANRLHSRAQINGGRRRSRAVFTNQAAPRGSRARRGERSGP